MSARKIDGLVLVFAATSGALGALVDTAKKLLRIRGCALCTITHGALGEKPEWKTCREALGVPVEYFHVDDLPQPLRATVGALPPRARGRGIRAARAARCHRPMRGERRGAAREDRLPRGPQGSGARMRPIEEYALAVAAERRRTMRRLAVVFVAAAALAALLSTRMTDVGHFAGMCAVAALLLASAVGVLVAAGRRP